MTYWITVRNIRSLKAGLLAVLAIGIVLSYGGDANAGDGKDFTGHGQNGGLQNGASDAAPNTPASDGERKVCEHAKLRAADAYQGCLLRAYRKAIALGGKPDDNQLARCDEGFDRRFERAERDGACHTPGGASALRQLARRQVAQIVKVSTEPTGCANLDIRSDRVVCEVSTSGNAIDLNAILATISVLSDSTVMVIEAWAGDGGNGNNCCKFGGSGGAGGYARTVTTIGDVINTLGTTELYYYLGYNGTTGADAGGDGGTGTLVATQDLTATDPTAPTNFDSTMLFAGGGGGGGGARGSSYACNSDVVYALDGGHGGYALPKFGATGLKIKGGQDGVMGPYDGGYRGTYAKGGNVTGGANATPGSALPGDDHFAPLGGIGGNHSSPHIGFQNSTLAVTAGGGHGGNGGDKAGGGGGGGGYGGGGGGAEGDSHTGCTSSGGGGGASFALAPTAACSGAPTSRPSNPKGIQGWVQIIFDLGGFCQ